MRMNNLPTATWETCATWFGRLVRGFDVCSLLLLLNVFKTGTFELSKGGRINDTKEGKTAPDASGSGARKYFFPVKQPNKKLAVWCVFMWSHPAALWRVYLFVVDQK